MNPHNEDHLHDEIAPIAHSYWEAEGHPEGRAEEHWKRAEAHLISNRAEQQAAGTEPHARRPEPT